MTVRLQTFAHSVTLKKLVHRTDSYAGAASAPQEAIDLTQYMTENDTIHTTKALASPEGGMVITIADQLSTELQDTIYALVEPMDMIEIRATRYPQDFSGDPLPLIMRAYVSTIDRIESIGDDGAPQRQVVIRGNDSGKLWMINQVLYEFQQSSGKSFLDPFAMQAAVGIDGAPQPVGDYMQKLTDYMNTKTKALAAYGKQVVPAFKLVSTVKDGQAWVQAITKADGPLWGYVEAFVDRPWNEAFILDNETQPTLYFRPAPYKDLNGKFILPGAADPGTVDIAAVELISINMRRSDARVANFFWVPPGSATLESGGFLTAAALANALPVDADYGNNSPTLYGERMMRTETSLIPSDVTLPPTMLPPEMRAAAKGEYVAWNILRGAQLKAMNRDNSVLEEGTLTVNGVETLQIGKYARVTRGSVVSTSYITVVAHTIAPFHSWVSNLTVERGMGFYDRDKSDNFPFFAEGRPGPYTAAPRSAAR